MFQIFCEEEGILHEMTDPTLLNIIGMLKGKT